MIFIFMALPPVGTFRPSWLDPVADRRRVCRADFNHPSYSSELTQPSQPHFQSPVPDGVSRHMVRVRFNRPYATIHAHISAVRVLCYFYHDHLHPLSILTSSMPYPQSSRIADTALHRHFMQHNLSPILYPLIPRARCLRAK